MQKIIISFLVPLVLAACATTSKTDISSTGQNPSNGSMNAKSGGASDADITASKLAERTRLLEQLKKESVYFDFDESEVKPEFNSIIQNQANFLLTNKNDSATLEGNCDERGSAEYNLALGDRRANSVSHQLQILGVPKDRIKSVSFGNEKPRLTCHAEKCWKEDRRVDFIHQLN